MSRRWDELCMYCPMETFCESTLGDTCEYSGMSWPEVREMSVNDLNLLKEETDGSR